MKILIERLQDYIFQYSKNCKFKIRQKNFFNMLEKIKLLEYISYIDFLN